MMADSCLRKNYDITNEECSDCEDGILWVNSFELVCENCGIVTRTDSSDSTQSKTPIEEFQENRDDHRYENSGLVILPGGFFQAYKGDGIYGT